MISKHTGLLAMAALIGTAMQPASAHHSFAMFDNGKCLNITGSVRTFQWNFPHSWIWLNVPDGKGNVVAWGFEGEPPSNLSQEGWQRNSLKKGDKVTVRYSPLRDGRNGGAFSGVTLADGKVLASVRGRNDICAPKR